MRNPVGVTPAYRQHSPKLKCSAIEFGPAWSAFSKWGYRLVEQSLPHQRERGAIVRSGVCGVEFDRSPTGGQDISIMTADGVQMPGVYRDRAWIAFASAS
jgi:hypothetical protein